MSDNYGTIAGFRAYHLARKTDVANNVTDPIIQSALLVASEWLDGRYRTAFSGLKVGSRDQVREWPRTSVQDINGYSVSSAIVPAEIEHATYEAALRQINIPGTLIVDNVPNKYKQVRVEGAISVEFANYTNADDKQIKFAIIDAILAPILTANGGAGYYSGLSGDTARV